MSDMVTRCPACSTSFRITPGQIHKARGAVRCGSCLHIFNAEQHLVSGATAKPKKPTPKPAAKPIAAKKPEQVPLAIPEEAKPAPTKPKPPSPPAKPSGTPAKPTAAAKPAGLQFDQAQIDREAADDDNLLISDNMDKPVDTDEEPLLYTGPSTGGVSLFERRQKKEEPEFTDTSDESWAENLLDDEPPPSDPPAPPKGAENPLSVTTEPPPAPPAEKLKADSKTTPSLRFHIRGTRDEEEPEEPYQERIKAYDRERSSLLMGIDPEPVEFTVSEHRNWRRWLLWSSLSALALLLLVAQVAWLQFDRLSRQDPYRSYYQSACDLLGCTLPQRADTRQIRTYNLVVRDHPEEANALLVDAIILNNAGFTQPFPRLLLSFSDMDDNPVASREFTPEEYLRGELAGATMMPRNQPVHLSLEIADPGAHAVNYQLQIP